VCASVSGCGRHFNYWTDLEQFQRSHTSFGIPIEDAVTFGICIAVIAAVVQRQWITIDRRNRCSLAEEEKWPA